jgi:hypothetical protein
MFRDGYHGRARIVLAEPFAAGIRVKIRCLFSVYRSYEHVSHIRRDFGGALPGLNHQGISPRPPVVEGSLPGSG